MLDPITDKAEKPNVKTASINSAVHNMYNFNRLNFKNVNLFKYKKKEIDSIFEMNSICRL